MCGKIVKSALGDGRHSASSAIFGKPVFRVLFSWPTFEARFSIMWNSRNYQQRFCDQYAPAACSPFGKVQIAIFK